MQPAVDRLYDVAQVLIYSLTLATKDEDRSIPTSHGVLDRALWSAIDRGAFGEWAHDLHFANASLGLKCVELDRVIRWAQEADLTEDPNPSYRKTTIKVNPATARYLLRKLNVSEQEASQWGELLKAALDEELKKTSL